MSREIHFTIKVSETGACLNVSSEGNLTVATTSQPQPQPLDESQRLSTSREISVINISLDSLNPSEDKPHKCPTCNKGFSKKQVMKQHLSQVHSAAKQHKCQDCAYQTNRKTDLDRHIAGKHDKDAIHYECPDPKCRYSSTDKSHVTRHYESRHVAQKNRRQRSQQDVIETQEIFFDQLDGEERQVNYESMSHRVTIIETQDINFDPFEPPNRPGDTIEQQNLDFRISTPKRRRSADEQQPPQRPEGMIKTQDIVFNQFEPSNRPEDTIEQQNLASFSTPKKARMSVRYVATLGPDQVPKDWRVERQFMSCDNFESTSHRVAIIERNPDVCLAQSNSLNRSSNDDPSGHGCDIEQSTIEYFVEEPMETEPISLSDLSDLTVSQDEYTDVQSEPDLFEGINMVAMNKLNPEFKCIDCLSTFKTAKQLQAHSRRCRSSGPLQALSTRTLICDICGFHSYDKSMLRSHMNMHHSANQRQLHGCAHCIKNFSSLRNLKYHMRKMHSIFECHHCDQIFEWDEALEHHQNREHPRYQCDLCGRGFMYKHLLRQHMDLHRPIFMTQEEEHKRDKLIEFMKTQKIDELVMMREMRDPENIKMAKKYYENIPLICAWSRKFDKHRAFFSLVGVTHYEWNEKISAEPYFIDIFEKSYKRKGPNLGEVRRTFAFRFGAAHDFRKRFDDHRRNFYDPVNEQVEDMEVVPDMAELARFAQSLEVTPTERALMHLALSAGLYCSPDRSFFFHDQFIDNEEAGVYSMNWLRWLNELAANDREAQKYVHEKSRNAGANIRRAFKKYPLNPNQKLKFVEAPRRQGKKPSEIAVFKVKNRLWHKSNLENQSNNEMESNKTE